MAVLIPSGAGSSDDQATRMVEDPGKYFDEARQRARAQAAVTVKRERELRRKNRRKG